MVKKYRVIFKGLNKSDEEFKERMYRMGVPSETLDEIVRRAPVVIKKDVTLKYARQYADAVQEAGGIIKIQECGWFEEEKHFNQSTRIISLEDFRMCPECGYKQPKKNKCVKCGCSLADSSN
ncbi:MAG TPA: hypothetical protein PK874_13835 [Desulfobacteraceae bacterium]|jgi:hypothetical protein|nr:hypothetical protein [Desulfobacteraceae bacterium]HPJ67723.1 hypothetical protein [Desulfobacteraceae bacterium]HPQ29643.1 hypothetical protein [Desulfobacteraceae bacterium]